MRDIGEDVKRGRALKLASAAQKNFLENWCEENEQNFVEVMDLIKTGAPVKYAELYLKARQMITAKESNIKITVSRQQDRENLQALVRTRIPTALPQSSPTTVPAGSPSMEYTPYVEIKKEEQL